MKSHEHKHSVDEILDIIDEGLASYDAYREQRDAEDRLMATEGVVLSGLDKAVRAGFLTVAEKETEMKLFHDQNLK